MIENLEDLRAFLQMHPAPTVVRAFTIQTGTVVCIKPMPTICGAEVMCSISDRDEVVRLVAGGGA